MKIDLYSGKDAASALSKVRSALGSEAVILFSGPRPGGGIDLLGADPEEVESLRRLLSGHEAENILRVGTEPIRPKVVALVGPAGAGKTTAIMKLALNPRGFGANKVGIISLDTYRVGGLDEIRSYAEVTGIPIEILYHESEVSGAVARLRDRDIILVDTPGRLNAVETDRPDWIHVLLALGPDEVHLACPAGIRLGLARRTRWNFERCKPTHLLLTRVDEALRDPEVVDIVRGLGLPGRWISSGHDVPESLSAAFPGIIDALTARRHSTGGGAARAARSDAAAVPGTIQALG